MLTINGEIWTIVFVDSTHEKLIKPDGTVAAGVCHRSSNTIYLSKELKGNSLRKVLRHEIAHAVMRSYELELTYVEEELVAGVIDVFGDEVITLTNNVYKLIKGR